MTQTKKKNKEIVIPIWATGHQFGIILPMKSGIIWNQQANGVCCSQPGLEGVFIPMQTDDETMSRIAQLNYVGMNSIKEWNKINDDIPKYERILPPKDLKNIKVYTSVYSSSDGNEKDVIGKEGIPHSMEAWIWIRILEGEFKGKIAVLTYENSD